MALGTHSAQLGLGSDMQLGPWNPPLAAQSNRDDDARALMQLLSPQGGWRQAAGLKGRKGQPPARPSDVLLRLRTPYCDLHPPESGSTPLQSLPATHFKQARCLARCTRRTPTA